MTPGSEQVRATIERDGLLADFEALGATVLANACGPCIGQWDRSGDEAYVPGQANVIVTSYNRNFPKRNDGDAATLAFVTSPETVMALALAGTLDFDPVHGVLHTDSGEPVSLPTPVGVELPPAGFDPGESGFVAPPTDRAGVDVHVSPSSDRLQVLAPFEAWDGNDYEDLPVLVKAQGKFTTDHISMAGPWLRYRGHLENISGNLYLGAVNAFEGYEVGHGKNQLTGETQPYPEIAKAYHEAGVNWVVIGDENMGEGSSREHAAMEPRLPGRPRCAVPQFRPHPRDQPEEAGHAAAHVRRPDRLRPHRRGRSDLGAGPCRPGARTDRHGRGAQAVGRDNLIRDQPHLQCRTGEVVQGRLGTQHHPGLALVGLSTGGSALAARHGWRTFRPRREEAGPGGGPASSLRSLGVGDA